MPTQINEATARNMDLAEKEKAGLIPADLIPVIEALEENAERWEQEYDDEQDKHSETRADLRTAEQEAEELLQDAVNLFEDVLGITPDDDEDLLGIELRACIEGYLTRAVNHSRFQIS